MTELTQRAVQIELLKLETMVDATGLPLPPTRSYVLGHAEDLTGAVAKILGTLAPLDTPIASVNRLYDFEITPRVQPWPDGEWRLDVLPVVVNEESK